MELPRIPPRSRRRALHRIDPYYLTHKAQAVGYHAEIILAGRRFNDQMGSYVASQLVKRMGKENLPVRGARVLVLGLTIKENTPDLRNSHVVDILTELAEYDISVDVHDPWVCAEEASHHYGVDLVQTPEAGSYAAVVIAVAHQEFVEMGAEKLRSSWDPNGQRALRPQAHPGQVRVGSATVIGEMLRLSADVDRADLARSLRRRVWVAATLRPGSH